MANAPRIDLMSRRSVVGALLAAAALAGCRAGRADLVPVLTAGEQLARFLDAMDVEKHWIAGHHVNWRTGDPDARPVPTTGHHSHCSAFVAAVATRLSIGILHPPEHNQVLLANAQCRWLRDEGPKLGWLGVATPLEAQILANRGMLVVACWIDPDPELPGHIAIVRPHAESRRRIESEGPQVTQAGIENYRSTTLAHGFRHHPGAWAHRAILFYAHAVSSRAIGSASGATEAGSQRGQREGEREIPQRDLVQVSEDVLEVVGGELMTQHHHRQREKDAAQQRPERCQDALIHPRRSVRSESMAQPGSW